MDSIIREIFFKDYEAIMLKSKNKDGEIDEERKKRVMACYNDLKKGLTEEQQKALDVLESDLYNDNLEQLASIYAYAFKMGVLLGMELSGFEI